MKEKLKNIISLNGIAYADARYESNTETVVSYEGPEIKEARTSSRDGFNLRVYSSGGKASGSYSSLDEAGKAARFLAGLNKASSGLRKEEIRIAPAPVRDEKFEIHPVSDPRGKSLGEKKELLESYNRTALEQDGVINTRMAYEDFSSRRIFVSSEGAEIEYELLICGISGVIITGKNGVIQTKRIAFGGSPEFSAVEGREEDLLSEISIAQKLPSAGPVKGGRCPVVLNTGLAAVFVHEAFGHLSESDIIQDNPSFLDRLPLGASLAGGALSISDDPGLKNLPGSYEIDDEGVPAGKTLLVRDGVLSGRLHSRETACFFDEPLTGNMRAVDCGYSPIIRMSNIFIENGSSTKQELFSGIDKGFYLCNARGGQTSGDQFTFGAEYGYRIANGVLKEMVRDINISGELFSALRNISAVAGDLEFLEYGGCGKGSPMQLNRFSGLGAPHIKIDSVNVGGL